MYRSIGRAAGRHSPWPGKVAPISLGYLCLGRDDALHHRPLPAPPVRDRAARLPIPPHCRDRGHGQQSSRPGPTAVRRMSGNVSVPPYRKAARNPSVPASRQMPASAAATSGGSIHLASARSARRRPLAAMMAGPGRQIERFRCSYGLNHEYLEVLTANGLRFSGSGDTGPVRIAERPGHPFFPGHPGPARTARRRHPPAPDHRRPCRRGG